MFEKRFGEEKQNTLSQQPWTEFFRRLSEFGWALRRPKNTKKEHEGEIPRAASCASASVVHCWGSHQVAEDEEDDACDP